MNRPESSVEEHPLVHQLLALLPTTDQLHHVESHNSIGGCFEGYHPPSWFEGTSYQKVSTPLPSLDLTKKAAYDIADWNPIPVLPDEYLYASRHLVCSHSTSSFFPNGGKQREISTNYSKAGQKTRLQSHPTPEEKDPYFMYGFVRCIYGFCTGKIWVLKKWVHQWNYQYTGLYGICMGFVREIYGLLFRPQKCLPENV